MVLRSIPFKQNSSCLRCGKNSLLTDQVAGEKNKHSLESYWFQMTAGLRI